MASRSFAPFTCNTYLQFWSSHIFLTLLIRYYVNRDTLFSYHKASEVFLQRLMALYVASHYKVITSFVSCILWSDKCLFWQIYEGFQTRSASHLLYHTGSINRASFFKITGDNGSYLFIFPSQNTPNDLQLLSDAPAHHIFCLLGPVDPAQNTLPEVYCVLQVKTVPNTAHTIGCHNCLRVRWQKGQKPN